jgi:hypothetical protein
MKLLVEQCAVLDICVLQRTVKKEITINYPEATEEEKLELTTKEFNNFMVGGQSFQYINHGNHFGGFRWFFLCERCGQQVRKLFFPPKERSEYEQRYLCKKCHKLCNESTMAQNRQMYRRVFKPLKRLQEIEQKLEKGYLRNNKVEELLNEYEALEASMKHTVEYRLYAFKKRGELRAKNNVR